MRIQALALRLLVSTLGFWVEGRGLAGVLEGTPWTLARSEHFEVYSHAGSSAAGRMLAHFEELRLFFDQQQAFLAVRPATKLPVRVILFNSKSEYDAYKVRPIGDAYYSGTADGDYIVMPRSKVMNIGSRLTNTPIL